MVLSEIFCANPVGAETMRGDLPNFIIGTSLCMVFYVKLNFVWHQLPAEVCFLDALLLPEALMLTAFPLTEILSMLRRKLDRRL